MHALNSIAKTPPCPSPSSPASPAKTVPNLTELLLSQGYEVHGAVRRTSTLERSRLAHLYHDASLYNRRLFLHYADLDDPTTLRRVLLKVAPEEIYHLAGHGSWGHTGVGVRS